MIRVLTIWTHPPNVLFILIHPYSLNIIYPFWQNTTDMPVDECLKRSNCYGAMSPHGIGILGSLLFYLLIQKTRIGLAMRATLENLQAAQTLGIPARDIIALSWGMAAFIGVLAGLFLAAQLLIDPFFMLGPFFKGFAAAILGGLNSLPGAIVDGLVLGVVEALFGGFISVAFKNTLAFLIIIVVLVFRPEGLLGKEFIERIYRTRRCRSFVLLDLT